jgi:hypothetical protein
VCSANHGGRECFATPIVGDPSTLDDVEHNRGLYWRRITSMRTSNITIGQVMNRPYIMDQPYQRGLVWGETRKQNLIKSILLGIPIGAIIVNRRGEACDYTPVPGFYDGGDLCDAIIDGKQRITTLKEFMNGDLVVPGGWFDNRAHLSDPTARHVTWGDLTARARRIIQEAPLPIMETLVGSIEKEESIFNLINFGGVPQGETDL